MGKNWDKDCWISAMRTPYERVFSKRSKRVRYKSIENVQFQVGMNALCHNIKRLIVLETAKIPMG